MPAPPGMARIALVIGLLGMVGPFSIDMYLPALPLVTADLAATPQAVQFTLSAYFAAFGLSQLVYGPLSDRMGRKPPLYIGVAIFIAGSLACALAPTIGTLVAARFVQGLGAATVMVVPRAIIRDLHTGPAATRLMATVMLVISISPMLAPLAGSGVLLARRLARRSSGSSPPRGPQPALTAFLLPETLPPEHRTGTTPAAMARGARRLLSDGDFMGLTLIGGFAMASFFIFIASASFVYTEQFGLSPTGFSIAFALNAIGFFGASQTAATLGERFGMARLVLSAVAGFTTIVTLLLVRRPRRPRAPARHRRDAVSRQHLPRRGDADDDGHGARPAPRRRRPRLLARRHAADARRRRDDRARRPVLRRHAQRRWSRRSPPPAGWRSPRRC